MTLLETPSELRPLSDALAAIEGEASTHPLHENRRAAFARFGAEGFPTTRDEAWKYTSLSALTRLSLARPTIGTTDRDRVDRLCFGKSDAITQVFVDGRYAPSLSSEVELPAGAFIGSITAAPAALAARVREIASEPLRGAFDALNQALTEDGALVFLPRDTALGAPVHLVFVATHQQGPTAAHPRSVVVAEAGARLDVIESYVTDGGEVYLTNAVTDVIVGENARVDHYKLQRESTSAFHVAALHARTASNATFRTFLVATGGRLVRHELHAPMDAEGATTCAYGLMLLDGEQHCDAHLMIDHARPRCASEQMFKSILGGRSHGVFSGRVHVAVDAQKTDAQQSCKNLLLSDDAVITTRPQLEIHADDVKCSHGVAIGSLDEDQRFYLRARGIGPREAQDILTYAFASELLTRFEVAAVRADVERRISFGLAAASESLREEA